MLRKAAVADMEAWVSLNREFMDFEIADEGLWNSTNKDSDAGFERVFREALENPKNITIFMIEEEHRENNKGEIIGFVNLMTIFSVWAKGKALIIDDLYIKPEFQGKGLGRKVLAEIEDYARTEGYRRLQFQSEKTNPGALKFYKAIGYMPTEMYFYLKYLQN